jgi:hypothetical protein
MAEDKRFLKGLFKDTAHIDQPESSWRYAKNVIINNKKGSLSNEGGTELSGHLGETSITGSQVDKVIGKIEVNDNKVILFIKDIVAPTNARSEIGIWENGTYTILYNPNVADNELDLNFQEDYPIEGTFKIDSKGDLVIYFTDDLNPPRAFNVDRQIRESGTSEWLLYGFLPNDIELLNLFPHAGSVPHVELDDLITHQASVLEGGGLLTGVYYLALAYVDDDFVSTNFVTVSNPISIVDEFDHTVPTTKKDGAKEGSQTTKAIKWKVSNLNNDYKYLKAVIIRKMGDATEAFKLQDLEITTANRNVVFSGIEGTSPASVEDVIIDTASYTAAKTIQQLDNVLYIGNLTSSVDLGYQKYANNIKLRSTTKEIKDFDEVYATVDNLETGFLSTPVNNFSGSVQTVNHTQSYRYAPNIFKYKGYMRDEVYAFYIAFILKDGTTSYAYHIPGREHIGQENSTSFPSSLGPLYNDLKKLNSQYAKRFHFIDSSAAGGAKQMNYWQNATEVYPNTDNFEVWDGNTQLGDIKGNPVRHHHFPSNRNPGRKTITKTNCRTDVSEGTGTVSMTFDNDVFRYEFTGNTTQYKVIEDHWKKTVFPDVYTNPDPDLQTAGQSMFNGIYFTAPHAMDVEVAWLVQYRQSHNVNIGTVYTECHTVINGADTIFNDDQIGNGNFGGVSGCSQSNTDYNSSHPDASPNPGYDPNIIHLDIGDKIYLQHKRTKNNRDVRQCEQSEICTNLPQTFVEFRITSSVNQVPKDSLYDAKISHNVDILGFELQGIKIPQSIRDQIQGFRVYYAKRDHADKTVLGQAPMLPMKSTVSQLGICNEASFDNDSVRVLQTLTTTPEEFWQKHPSSQAWWEYGDYNLYIEGSSGTFNYTTPAKGYKVFNFPAFELLRTHNSISAATHIDVQYVTRNLVFNGPTLAQDKKMVSFVEEDAQSGIEQITQKWNYDTEFNCYPEKIKSSIHIGNMYEAPYLHTMPRAIGQKAKTYLPADSIFDATNLGFGAKLVNEFGESGLAIGLKDEHELSAYKGRMEPYIDNGHPNWIGNEWGYFNYTHDRTPSILVNPLPPGESEWDPNTHPDYDGSNRSKSYISNLKAFKTDIYKSIDSQELVWTGFEVLGDDLDYFTIDNSNVNANGNVVTPHYNTNQLNTVNGTTHEGIFGGDTYICRYGIASGITPNNREDKSNPHRAIHYHIVESTDNINFRHTQDGDSIYFPGTPAKTVLKSVGLKDLVSTTNLRYNDNYTELNNLRTAFPLPLTDSLQDNFPTRTHRSAKADTTSLIDNYRIFLANQFKDLPKNRGDLWSLASFNNLLYFHMEESLFAAKGKQTMEMKDGSEAFIGSGDLFQQEPDEIIQTEGGYAGTHSQWASLTTRYGYFFIDKASRKVFLMADQLQEISAVGMEKWFKDNLAFKLEAYGFTSNLDNPILGIGFTSTWDPKNRRIILTKREYEPTDYFIANSSNITYSATIGQFMLGGNSRIEWTDSTYFKRGGWTISYSPESSTWTSFHDYIPYIYFNTSTDFYSLTDQYAVPIYTGGGTNTAGTTYGNAGIWKHNSEANRGILYQENTAGTLGNAQWLNLVNHYKFEIEFIHNENKASNVLVANLSYTLDAFNQSNVNILDGGFTDFFIYNTNQISGLTELEYLINTRKIGNEWNINKFRDMARLEDQTGNLNLPNTSSYYMSSSTNLLGGSNTGTITTSSTNTMFTIDGMTENINTSYIDTAKTWDQQRKFTDKWVGIRLICDNKQNNLLNLYSTSVGVRKVYR